MKNAIYLILIFTLFSCRKINPNPDIGDNLLLVDLKQYVVQQTTPDRYDSIIWPNAKPIRQNNTVIGYSIQSGKVTGHTRRLVALYKEDQWTCTFQDIKGSVDTAGLFNGDIVSESLNGRTRQLLNVKDNNTQRLRSFADGQLVKDIEPGFQGGAGRSVAYYSIPPGAVIINRGLYYWVNNTGSWGTGDSSGVQQPVATYLNADAPGSGEGGGNNEELVEVEYYDMTAEPGVDIEKLFRCFDAVPDFPGATYELTLNTDVPVNSRPYAAVKNWGFSPGHTFLTITKKNATQSVTQNFGFYPKELGLHNVPSKIVDDKSHEINAKLTIPISQYDFSSIRANAIYLATLPYNLVEYNCTDYAVELFNLSRDANSKIQVQPFPITIELFGVTITTHIHSSPQMLFHDLRQRKESNSADAPNIVIDQTRGTKSPVSNGECD